MSIDTTLKCIFSLFKNLHFLTKPKILLGFLRLNITRAPPWYFPPIFQSCLLPRLWPPLIICQQFSFHLPSDGPQLLNVAFPAVLVPSWHPPLLHAICLNCAACPCLFLPSSAMSWEYHTIFPPHKDTGQIRLSPLTPVM